MSIFDLNYIKKDSRRNLAKKILDSIFEQKKKYGVFSVSPKFYVNSGIDKSEQKVLETLSDLRKIGILRQYNLSIFKSHSNSKVKDKKNFEVFSIFFQKNYTFSSQNEIDIESTLNQEIFWNFDEKNPFMQSIYSNDYSDKILKNPNIHFLKEDFNIEKYGHTFFKKDIDYNEFLEKKLKKQGEESVEESLKINLYFHHLKQSSLTVEVHDIYTNERFKINFKELYHIYEDFDLLCKFIQNRVVEVLEKIGNRLQHAPDPLKNANENLKKENESTEIIENYLSEKDDEIKDLEEAPKNIPKELVDEIEKVCYKLGAAQHENSYLRKIYKSFSSLNSFKHIKFSRMKKICKSEKEVFKILISFEFWKLTLNHPQSFLREDRFKKIKKIFDAGYDMEQVIKAIVGISNSKFHMGANASGTVYDSFSNIFKTSEIFENFIEICDNLIKSNEKFMFLNNSENTEVKKVYRTPVSEEEANKKLEKFYKNLKETQNAE